MVAVSCSPLFPPESEQGGNYYHFFSKLLSAFLLSTGLISIVSKVETGFWQEINFEFRIIHFGYIKEEVQFCLNSV